MKIKLNFNIFHSSPIQKKKEKRKKRKKREKLNILVMCLSFSI